MFYFIFACSGVVDDKPLKFRGEAYHPYHFNCTACGVELNSDAREVRSRPGYAANEMVKLILSKVNIIVVKLIYKCFRMNCIA